MQGVFEKIDILFKMEYNRSMVRIKIAIIGGGAAGLFLANALGGHDGVTLFERGERVGRKLSATGNGQGNITNLAASRTEYFSLSGGEDLAKRLIEKENESSLSAFFRALGVPCVSDERGRVYPASRQASALTDALRFALQKSSARVKLGAEVVALTKEGDGFCLRTLEQGEARRYTAERVVLCAGGKAAKNFGTDGSAYALAQGLGHTVTKLYPSLVQLKTETRHTKSLKGIRVNDGVVRVKTPKREFTVQGDVIFTDYGVSGDAVFRLSAFIAEEIGGGECVLHLDFLPQYKEEEIYALLRGKSESFSFLSGEELLFGIVNNQLGRAILRRADGDLRRAAALVKDFPLPVTGSLGFDYAQVTKGGIPLTEVTENLESRLVKNVYFAGELLDVDGQCGGFNLQWAYSSAQAFAKAISK